MLLNLPTARYTLFLIPSLSLLLITLFWELGGLSDFRGVEILGDHVLSRMTITGRGNWKEGDTLEMEYFRVYVIEDLLKFMSSFLFVIQEFVVITLGYRTGFIHTNLTLHFVGYISPFDLPN